MKVIDFRLPDQNGKEHKLSDYFGRWIVLYFYPKDDTPGCTEEAKRFRDAIAQYEERNVQILGISKDSIESHKKFSDKYHLNFPILSDEDKKMIKAYRAWGEKKFMGKAMKGTLRMSYLINPKGEIEKVYEHVNPFFHSDQILKDLNVLLK